MNNNAANNNILNIGGSFLAGYLIGGANGVVTETILGYLISVWLSRTTVAFLMNSIGIEGNYLRFIPDIKENHKFFDDTNIVFQYNWWHNKITIKRNLSGWITTDKDKINALLKKVFNMLFCWDIFYQYTPLQIVYE